MVYFLLKWHQDGREEKFALQKCIPPQFAALADAYWHLDSGINLAYGVSILADARLNRDYASKILQAISLSPDASTLIRKYVQTAKPPLTEPDDIELYTLALADSSLLEAWQFQRTFHESKEIRPRLFRGILEWCVSPKPRPAALMQLLGLPLSAFEESTLHSYVLKPPTNSPLDALPLLQDLVCVRLIQLGRYIEAIRMDREFSASKIGANARQSQERSKMVQDLYNALPAIERAHVDAELAAPSAERAKPQRSGQRTPPGEDVDMAQSWEEIRSSELQASTSKHPASRPIPERANAPRFGGPAPSLPTIPTPPRLPTTTNAVQARQSFPMLPTTFATPSGSRPRTSLSNTAGRLVLGTLPHVSSPLSGAKFPAPSLSPNQPQKTAGNLFMSANQQPNAFYTPPAKVNGHAQPIFPPRPQPPPVANGNAEKPSAEKADDAEMEVEGNENTKEKEHDEEMDHRSEEQVEPKPTEAEEEEKELGYSVFGNELSSWANIENKQDRTSDVPDEVKSLSKSSTSMKRKVPGSFGDDDEDEDMEDSHHHHHHRRHSEKPRRQPEMEDEEPASSRPTRSKQQSISTRSTATRKKAKSKRNDSKEPKRRRSSGTRQNIPGTLMDEEAEEEEEEDHVAPLRTTTTTSTKPPSQRRSGASTTTKPVSRGSTTSDMADELGEGVQTRRRSSRLTATGSGATVVSSSGGVDGDASPRKSARTRKPTTKTGTSGRGKKRAGA